MLSSALHNDSPVLKTERLTLRPWLLSDVNDFYAYCSQDDVGPAAGWMPVKDFNACVQSLQSYYVHNPTMWAIAPNEVGKAVGAISLRYDNKRNVPRTYILGYSMNHDYWGRGYMTEAARRIIVYTFESLQAVLLATDHYPHNVRSKRVIEKCGFTYEGTLRKASKLANGQIFDELVYSITREEYLHDLKRKWQ